MTHVCDFFNLKILARTHATNADKPETTTKLQISVGSLNSMLLATRTQEG